MHTFHQAPSPRLGKWLRSQLPNGPRSLREVYPRLAVVTFVIGAFLLLLECKSVRLALSIDGLWFQLAAAGLLWFESNASSDRVSLIVQELRQARFIPQTLAEKAFDWFGLALGWLILLMAWILVAAALWLSLSGPRLAAGEIAWTAIWIMLAGGVYLIGRFLDRSIARLRKSLINGKPAEEEIKVRRFLRTIAAVLFFLGTLGQSVSATLS